MFHKYNTTPCFAMHGCLLSFPHGIKATTSNTSTEMASPGSSSGTQSMAISLGQSILEKLSRENYILWKAQVLTAALGARRSGFLDRAALAPSKTIQVEQVDKTVKTEENPMYASWYAQDQ
jgi:hypothetical protein